MSRLIPKSGRTYVAGVLVLLMVAVVLTPVFLEVAYGAPYANPFWLNNSPSQESALCDVAILAMVCESQRCRAASQGCSVHCCGEKCCDVTVDARTGELIWDKVLFRTPGVLEDNVFAIRWRSMINGASQMGRQILPSWETTVEYVVLNEQDPNGPNGHMGRVRQPSGRIDDHIWNGESYGRPVDVRDTLTKDATGNYVLTDKWGSQMTFDAEGMPAEGRDRNGNKDIYTYDASYRMTAYTDDRGKSYSIVHNANKYITTISDPAGRSWLITYDAGDNLRTITTPSTPDQPTGITTTLGYDANNRLISVTDGRGNMVWQFGYVGATNQVSTVTINGESVSYSYAAGITTRTDRNGNIYRYYFTGTQVTKTDMLVEDQSKYPTIYRYSGEFPKETVFPRGNRVDTTYDAMGNLTEERHRTQDTSVNDPTDIVHQWSYSGSNFTTDYVDPRGNHWVLTRDSAGNLTSVTHPEVTAPLGQSASENWTYNSKGQLSTAVDEEGRSVRYTYGAEGDDKDLLVLIEVDPAGFDLEVSFEYDAMGNIVTLTDPRGNDWVSTWDDVRRLKSARIPSPLSHEKKYWYDGNQNLIKLEVENRDKNGDVVATNPWFTTTLTYSNIDKITTITEEVDVATTRTTTLEYDANGNRIRVIKPEGNKERWDFDERDLVVAHVLGETGPDAVTIQMVYDDNGNLTSSIDGRGNSTTRTYDLFDRLTRVTNALGHYVTYALDKNSNVTEAARRDSADSVLQRESYSFDQRNRLYRVSALFKEPGTTHPDAITTITRDKSGLVVKVTDALGSNTTMLYDAARRRIRVTDANGNERETDYDANGNQVAWRIKEVDGPTTTTHEYEATYDVSNRRTRFTEIDRLDENNRLDTLHGYDSRGNMVWQVDSQGNPMRWSFDGLSRMVKYERAITVGASIATFTTAQVTTWVFDHNSRVVGHTDDRGNHTAWSYDALDRTVAMVLPDSSQATVEYDAAHNVTKTVDPAGNEICDVFDELNRNVSRSITLASGFIGTTTETRTFDALDRIIANADNDYSVGYDYAVIGFTSYFATETQSYVGQAAYPKSVNKTFDAVGNRITEVYPAGASLSLTMTYDAIHQLTGISDGTNTIASYGHIGSRRNQTSFHNGATTNVTYTGFRNEVASIQHKTGAGATIVRLDYAYNDVHDNIYERFGGPGSSGDAFEYDKLRRVTKAWMGSVAPESPSGNEYLTTVEYNYDDDGNRTTVVTTPYGQAAQTTSYSTNVLNQYASVGGTTYFWDPNGNIRNNGTYKFTYNYKNLIAEVRRSSDNSLVATYRYDADGRRVEKSVAGGAFERYILSSVETIAVYGAGDVWKQNFVFNDDIDGVEMIEQADVLDYDADGNTTERTRSFYHRNAAGSVMEITDANENVVVSYRYDVYGDLTIEQEGQTQATDPLGQHWSYTGRFLDEETGLYHYRARTYDPSLGRFLQRDPLGYAVGPNLYEYASSNPTNFIDPFGLRDCAAESKDEAECKKCCDEESAKRNRVINGIQGQLARLERKIGALERRVKKDLSSEGAAANYQSAIKKWKEQNHALINTYLGDVDWKDVASKGGGTLQSFALEALKTGLDFGAAFLSAAKNFIADIAVDAVVTAAVKAQLEADLAKKINKAFASVRRLRALRAEYAALNKRLGELIAEDARKYADCLDACKKKFCPKPKRQSGKGGSLDNAVLTLLLLAVLLVWRRRRGANVSGRR